MGPIASLSASFCPGGSNLTRPRATRCRRSQMSRLRTSCNPRADPTGRGQLAGESGSSSSFRRAARLGTRGTAGCSWKRGRQRKDRLLLLTGHRGEPTHALYCRAGRLIGSFEEWSQWRLRRYRAMSTKTDRNDARGIAELTPMGSVSQPYTPRSVRLARAAQRLLVARKQRIFSKLMDLEGSTGSRHLAGNWIQDGRRDLARELRRAPARTFRGQATPEPDH